MEQEIKKGDMHKDNAYEYTRFPENIRQVGESGGVCRMYIEDYVMTYMRRIFNEKQENAMLVLVGTYGKGVVSGCPFVYGAVLLEAEIMDGVAALTKDKWDDVYRQIHEYFSGAQILGWAFGVNLWNSHADNIIRQIQKKFFCEEGKILFLSDLSEKDERVFFWKNGELKEQPGYVIYFEKNSEMQDYMLGSQESKSFESDYTDTVTDEIRGVIEKKEEWKKNRQQYVFGSFVALVLFVLVIGGNILLSSLSKIESLEQSIAAMKNDIKSDTQMSNASDGKEMDISNTSQEKGKDAKEVISKGINENKSDKDNKTNSPKNDSNGNQSGGEKTNSSPSTVGNKTDSAKADNGNMKDNDDNSGNGNAQDDKKDKSNSGKAGSGQSASNTPSKITEKPSVKITDKPKTDASNSGKTVVALGRKYDSYIVQKGDTLSQIVWKQYHSFAHLKAIKKVNKIKNADEIYQGQCIILPRFED